jgi:hypothetical protein
MRRLTATLLVACVLGTGATPATAQEPSPPPWFGGRVEMPEHGYAVTVPDGWVAFDLEGDVVAQVEAVQAHTAETPTEPWDGLRSSLRASSVAGGQLLALEPSDIVKQSCNFQRPSGEALLEDALVEIMYEDMVAHDSFVEVMPPRPVTIEGARGWLFATSHQDSYYTDEQGWLAMYRLTTDGGGLAVTCSGDERPTDDWLSMVETLEFLPAEE